MGTFPRSVLVSPGYGAGWSSWTNNKEVAQFVAEYKPIIEFLENGGKLNSKEFNKLVDELEEYVEEEFNCSFYTGGATNLEVVVVNGPYKINEYNGSERIEEKYDGDLWFY